MRECRVADSIFDRADFFRSSLAGSTLERSSLRRGCFLHADLSGCRVAEVRWTGSLFGRTAFSAVSLMCSVFDDCVVASPHRIEVRELKELHGWAYALRITADRTGDEPSDAVPREVSEGARRLCGQLPALVDFLQRGGVNADLLVPITNVIGQSTQPRTGGVFLSYATSDQPLAAQLAELLEAQDFEVWFAPRSLRGGQKVYDQLVREIDERDRLVLLVSDDSMASAWVQLELLRALRPRDGAGLTGRVLPLVLASDEAWRAWRLIDPDSGRDLAAELRAGPWFSLRDLQAQEDSGAGILRAIIENLRPPARPPETAAPKPN